MALSRGTNRLKMTCAILFYEFHYSQLDIANMVDVSPSTISSWITFGELLLRDPFSQQEAALIVNDLHRMGYYPLRPLNSNLKNYFM